MALTARVNASSAPSQAVQTVRPLLALTQSGAFFPLLFLVFPVRPPAANTERFALPGSCPHPAGETAAAARLGYGAIRRLGPDGRACRCSLLDRRQPRGRPGPQSAGRLV